ncbi:MAG: HupE/UreJ family protein [Thiolinea sp.]
MNDFFMQGLWHPLLTPSHLVVMVALGLLAGQQGVGHVKAVVPVFLMAVCAVLGLTILHLIWPDAGSWLLILALMTGLLIIMKTELPVWFLLVLAVAAALLVGLESAAPRIPGLRGTKVYAFLGGTALSATLVVTLSSMPGLLLRNVLDGVPLRVLGAWITAGAALVLALKVSSFSL